MCEILKDEIIFFYQCGGLLYVARYICYLIWKMGVQVAMAFVFGISCRGYHVGIFNIDCEIEMFDVTKTFTEFGIWTNILDWLITILVYINQILVHIIVLPQIGLQALFMAIFRIELSDTAVFAFILLFTIPFIFFLSNFSFYAKQLRYISCMTIIFTLVYYYSRHAIFTIFIMVSALIIYARGTKHDWIDHKDFKEKVKENKKG